MASSSSSRCGRKALVVMTTQCATASLATLLLGIVTNSWLSTSERTETNNTVVFVNSTSGLWWKCLYSVLTVIFSCAVVAVTMRRAAIFPAISVLVLVIGQIMCLVSVSQHSLKSLTLAASVLYVAGGLCTLIGIILYIGAITEEVGNLSSKKPAGGEARMSYDYGISFVLAVGSFLLSELAGVLLVYLYVSKHSHDYAAKVQHGYYYTTDNASPLSAGHYRFDNSASTGGDSKLSHYCNGNSGGSNGKVSSSQDNRNGNGGSKSNGRYGNHGGHEGVSLARNGNGNGNENGSAGKRCHCNSNKSCNHSPSQSDAYGHAQTGGGCGSVSRDVSCYTSLSMGTRDSSHHTVSTLNDVSSDTVSTITMRNYDNHRLTTQV